MLTDNRPTFSANLYLYTNKSRNDKFPNINETCLRNGKEFMERWVKSVKWFVRHKQSNWKMSSSFPVARIIREWTIGGEWT